MNNDSIETGNEIKIPTQSDCIYMSTRWINSVDIVNLTS